MGVRWRGISVAVWLVTLVASAAATNWIDKDTPSAANSVTVQSAAYGLVFSDEFNADGRSFYSGADSKWEALDVYYAVTGDHEVYKPYAATTKGGYGTITFSQNVTYDRHGQAHDFVSAMVSSWNKFCFTGGYVEASVQLPGDGTISGFWPALWSLGNLGKPGSRESTDGLWPFSYSVCDPASGPVSWEGFSSGQKISACDSAPGNGLNPRQGRGVPEWDLVEAYGGSAGGGISTTLQIAPLLPPGLSYAANLSFPGATTPFETERNPYQGNLYQDSVSALSKLSPSHFSTFHKYALEWGPGVSMRWFLDDTLVYEILQEALRGQTNNAGQSVGQRDIPLEPMYLIWNLASAEDFSPLDKTLPMPGSLLVDYIRVYQKPGSENVDCSPAAFPTAQYIAANPSAFDVPVCGDRNCDTGECVSCHQDCSAAMCNEPAPSAAYADCAVSILHNPTFGSDSPCTSNPFLSGWNFDTKSPAEATLGCLERGGALVSVTNGATDPFAIQLSQLGVSLQANTKYVISVTALATRSAGSLATAAPALRALVDTGWPNYSPIGSTDTNWIGIGSTEQTYAFGFTGISAARTARVALQFGTSVNSGVSFAIKSVTLTCSPPPSSAPAGRPLLYNSNFNIGPSSGCTAAWSAPWAFGALYPAAANFSCISGDKGVATSTQITVANGGTEPFHIQMSQGGLYLKAGTKYTLAIRGKTQYSVRSVQFVVDSGSPEFAPLGGLPTYTIQMDNYLGTWTQTFTPSSDVTGNGRLVLNFGNIGAGLETFTLQSVSLSTGSSVPQNDAVAVRSQHPTSISMLLCCLLLPVLAALAVAG